MSEAGEWFILVKTWTAEGPRTAWETPGMGHREAIETFDRLKRAMVRYDDGAAPARIVLGHSYGGRDATYFSASGNLAWMEAENRERAERGVSPKPEHMVRGGFRCTRTSRTPSPCG